jgi:hypothetical protein
MILPPDEDFDYNWRVADTKTIDVVRTGIKLKAHTQEYIIEKNEEELLPLILPKSLLSFER